MILIVDTNVLLSAALRDRLPERVILAIAAHDDWKWVITPEIMREYVNVLSRPKFAFGTELIERWTQLLTSRTLDIGPPPIQVDFARDRKDAPFLAAALLGQADYLITGDSDLLSLKSFKSTNLVTTAEFARVFDIQ